VLQRDDCLKEINRINRQLERLAMQLPSSIRKFSKTSKVMSEYCRARELAINLHGVFQEKLQDISLCSCSTPHNANLRLPRVRGRATEQVPMPIIFEVLFSFELSDAGTSWRGLEFEPSTAPISEPSTAGACPAENNTSKKARGTGRKMIDRMAAIFRPKPGVEQTASTIPLSPAPTANPKGRK